MGRTLRSRKQRAALYQVAAGKCSICQCDLMAGWHADHIVPWSISGTTKYEEMQALCPACNIQKGNTVSFVPRDWQSKAWAKLQTSKTDFFLEATPGAGKTKFSSWVASKKIASGLIDRVVVVVPTLQLKKQWADDLHDFGINAEYKFISPPWPSDFNCLCVTYQQLANQADIFRYFCNDKKTLVVLDEVHHCADYTAWGESIKHACEVASFRICLSGTPFRTDNQAIPFLRYVDGKAIPDHVYGYGDGLRDGVCRHVFFPRQGGTVEWSDPGGRIKRHTFDDDVLDAEARQRLRTAVTTGWLDETIADANSKLQDMRQSDPDAGGLVIAVDQWHAKKIASRFSQQLGIEPTCVMSDDPSAQEKIESFRSSRDPWLIAIKMVSEGVDIKRLRVGVYATTVRTPMFFRQAVGRFVRVQEDHDDPTAVVYIPDDPVLRELASEIRQQRIHCLDEEIEQERKRETLDEELQDHDASYFMPISSDAESKGTIVDSFTFTAEQLRLAEEYSGGQCSPEVAAAILRRAGVLNGTDTTSKILTRPTTKTEERSRLRELNSKLVSQIAYAHGDSHKDINFNLNRRCGIQSVERATIDQLRKRLEIAHEWMRRSRIER